MTSVTGPLHMPINQSLINNKSLSSIDRVNNEIKSATRTTKQPKEAWKPENWAADNAYRHSLLDPELLPDTGNERYFLTRPTPGVSRSTDVYRTEFVPDKQGNITRIDYGAGEQIVWQTFIPNGQWRLAQSSSSDSSVGNVYARQESAYGFRVYLDRSGTGATKPKDYQPEAHRLALENMLSKALPYTEKSTQIRKAMAQLQAKNIIALYET